MISNPFNLKDTEKNILNVIIDTCFLIFIMKLIYIFMIFHGFHMVNMSGWF